MGAKDLEMTAGDRRGDRVGPGLDTVGDQVVVCVVERVDPLHQNAMRSGTFDTRPHCDQAECEIADLGIARSVQDFGFTPGKRGRHQGRLAGAYRWRGQHDSAAAQSVASGPRVDITRFYIDVDAERVESLEMQVDRPRADRAASR